MCMMINVTFTCVSSKKIIFNLMTFDKNVHLTPCVNVKPYRNLARKYFHSWSIILVYLDLSIFSTVASKF